MWKFIQKKLGITEINKKLNLLSQDIPALDSRNRQVLTAVESVLHVLKTPTADDSMVMFHLRSMGYCGGFNMKQPGGQKP